jgi:peptide/nickel transport system permease protein
MHADRIKTNKFTPLSYLTQGVKVAAQYSNHLRRRIGAVKRVLELPPLLIVGGTILLVYVVVAITGSWWAPFSETEIGTGDPFEGMSGSHWFGTDSLGRDVFSRTIIATRIELQLSVMGTLLGFAIGGTLGLAAALIGGVFDEVVMRLGEGLLSIPTLILAILLVVLLGPSHTGSTPFIVLVIGIVFTPIMARMARATALEITTRDFVAMAQLRGESTLSVVFRELLPNATGTLLVEAGVRMAAAPLLIGGLGFLGIGIRPPTAEWGTMITENRTALLFHPVTVLGPAFVLAGLVIGANFFTDGLARVLGRSAEFSGSN